jgi:hypothetical protein
MFSWPLRATDSKLLPNYGRILNMLKKLLLILFSLLSLRGQALASEWRKEVNERWGFSLTYPASLIPEPMPANGGGRRYHSANQEVSLVTSGSHSHPDLSDESLNGFWQKELADRGDTVTGKARRKTGALGSVHNYMTARSKVVFPATLFPLPPELPQLLNSAFSKPLLSR